MYYLLGSFILILMTSPTLPLSSSDENLRKATFIQNQGHLIPQANSITFLVPIKIASFQHLIDNVTFQISYFLNYFKEILPIKHFDASFYDRIKNSTQKDPRLLLMDFAIKVLIGNLANTVNPSYQKMKENLTKFMKQTFYEAKGELERYLNEVKSKFSKLTFLFQDFKIKRRKGFFNAIGKFTKFLRA